MSIIWSYGYIMVSVTMLHQLGLLESYNAGDRCWWQKRRNNISQFSVLNGSKYAPTFWHFLNLYCEQLLAEFGRFYVEYIGDCTYDMIKHWQTSRMWVGYKDKSKPNRSSAIFALLFHRFCGFIVLQISAFYTERAQHTAIFGPTESISAVRPHGENGEGKNKK